MNQEELDIKIKAALDAADAAKSVKDLKASMRELTGLAEEVGVDNVAAYTKIKEAAGAAADKIGDMNASTRALAGTPLENTTKSLGLIKDNLLSLDFDELNKNVTLFSSSLKKLNPAGLSQGFQTFGKTMLDLGKSLLTNPIFLIGAAIVFIISKFDELKASGGLVGKVFTAIGETISNTIKLITAFTDAIGLTAIEAQKATEQKLKYLEKEKDAIADKYATEIKLAEATHQNVGAIMLKQYAAELENAKATIKIYEGIKNEKGKLSDEETEKYEAALKDYKKIQDEAYQYAVQNAEKIYAAEKDAIKTIRQARIDNIRDETTRKKAQADFDFQNSKTELNKQLKERGDQLETARKAELKSVEVGSAEYNEITKRYIDLQNKIILENHEQVKAANDKKNLAIRQANQENAVKEKTRLLNEASEEVKINQDKLNRINSDERLSDEQRYDAQKRLIEERTALVSAEHLARVALIDKQLQYVVKGTEDEKKLLDDKKNANTDFYNILADLEYQNYKLSSDYNQKIKEDYLNTVIAKAEANKKYSANLKTQLDADIAIAIANSEKLLQNTKLTEEQRKAIIDNTNKETAALTATYTQTINDIRLNADLEATQTELENLQNAGSLRLGYENSLIKKVGSLRKEQLDNEKRNELAKVQSGSAAALAIEKKFAQQRKAVDADVNKAKLQNFAATSQQILGVASAAANALGALNDLITQNETGNLKKGEKVSLEIQKKQFNRQKALGIVGAIINTAQGVTQALGSSPPPYSFILAALVGVLGGLQIAKIASQKFNPETGSDSGGDAAAGPTITAPSLAAAPTLDSGGGGSKFRAGQFYEIGGASRDNLSGNNKLQPQKVYVVARDIYDTNRKTQVTQQRATLSGVKTV